MAIYNGKHCVFEQVGVDGDFAVWNAQTNVDNDGANNDWNISNIRTTTLPARLLLLSNALQDNLSNTTIQTATNGNNGTLISTSDKLFFPAEKETTTSPSKARTEENNALITWTYWTTHTTSSDRIKKDPSNNARYYWLRSPYSGNNNGVVGIRDVGDFYNIYARDALWFALCYAF